MPDSRTTATRPARAPHHRGGLVAASVAVLTIAQLFRQTGVHSWDTVWAEDGKYFFNGTNSVGDLFHQQAGYLQLTGRLFGLGAHVVRIDDVAIFYAVGGAALTSLMAAAVWYFSEPLVTSRVLRVVLALQVVLLPAMLLEQVANGVNAMWAVLYAGWWALVYRPRHTVGVVGASLVAVLAACSSSLALVFLPVAAVLAWRRPGRYRILAAAFGVGCVVQAVVTLGAPEVESSAHHAGDLPGIFSIRVLGSMLVGEQWVGDVWSAIGWGLAALTVAVTVGWLVVLAVRGKGEARVLGLVAVGYAVLLYFGELWVRGSVVMRIGSEYHSFGRALLVIVDLVADGRAGAPRLQRVEHPRRTRGRRRDRRVVRGHERRRVPGLDAAIAGTGVEDVGAAGAPSVSGRRGAGGAPSGAVPLQHHRVVRRSAVTGRSNAAVMGRKKPRPSLRRRGSSRSLRVRGHEVRRGLDNYPRAEPDRNAAACEAWATRIRHQSPYVLL